MKIHQNGKSFFHREIKTCTYPNKKNMAHCINIFALLYMTAKDLNDNFKKWKELLLVLEKLPSSKVGYSYLFKNGFLQIRFIQISAAVLESVSYIHKKYIRVKLRMIILMVVPFAVSYASVYDTNLHNNLFKAPTTL